ncbi:hypothetical protein V8C34DRAFT_304094 [Trichoderma compactum]
MKKKKKKRGNKSQTLGFVIYAIDRRVAKARHTADTETLNRRNGEQEDNYSATPHKIESWAPPLYLGQTSSSGDDARTPETCMIAQECEQIAKGSSLPCLEIMPEPSRTGPDLVQYHSEMHYMTIISELVDAKKSTRVTRIVVDDGKLMATRQTQMKTNAACCTSLAVRGTQLRSLQGSIVLGMTAVTGSFDRDFRYRIHNAVRLAVKMGLHKSPTVLALHLEIVLSPSEGETVKSHSRIYIHQAIVFLQQCRHLPFVEIALDLVDWALTKQNLLSIEKLNAPPTTVTASHLHQQEPFVDLDKEASGTVGENQVNANVSVFDVIERLDEFLELGAMDDTLISDLWQNIS